MQRTSGRWDDHAGFTLIEVLIALAITMAALLVINEALGDAFQSARTADVVRQAVSRAQSRLASITEPDRVLGQHDGDDGGGYTWRSEVQLTDVAAAPPNASPGPWARGTGYYTIAVTMFWRDAQKVRSYRLVGGALGPLPRSSP
jgi:prepilin-type N-terminal cleavage/methylation domain-containing protein